MVVVEEEEEEEEEAIMIETPHHLLSITPRMSRRGITPLRGRIIKGGDRGGMNGTEGGEMVVVEGRRGGRGWSVQIRGREWGEGRKERTQRKRKS